MVQILTSQIKYEGTLIYAMETEIPYKCRFLCCFSQVLLQWKSMPNTDQISLDKSFYS